MNFKLTLFLICIATCIRHFSAAQCDRKQMVDDYEEYFLGTQIGSSELGWTGDEKVCQPGHVSQLAMQAMLDRINYYRRLAKVGTEVGLDTSLTAMCQEAALMMHSNNELNHDPPETWSCWTTEGKKAASRSNLALGAHSSNAISLYMRDPGSNNWAVGHRRWILFSRAKDFGMGSTTRSHVLYVIHNKQPASEDLKFIAYPNEGYFPSPLLADRWSFSVPKAKFAQAKVEMEDAAGKPISVMTHPVKNGYGDPTIVWEPESGAVPGYLDHDVTYRVNIRNVIVAGDTLDYSYEVIIAPTQHPPACAGEAYIWSEEKCDCVEDQTTDVDEQVDLAVKLFPNPASHILQVSTGQTRSEQMEIYDMTGRLVQSNKLPTQDTQIDVSLLAEGIYLAKIFSTRQETSLLFVVQR